MATIKQTRIRKVEGGYIALHTEKEDGLLVRLAQIPLQELLEKKLLPEYLSAFINNLTVKGAE